MKAVLTQSLIRHLAPESYDIWDTSQTGLVLRVRQSGCHSYLVSTGRGKWFTLGRTDVLTPTQAREQAKKILGEVATGVDPMAEKRKSARDR